MVQRQPIVGIALDSGGAMGGAHIGVLEVLAENKIPIDIITGSSAGAAVGAFYAAGKLDIFKKLITDLSFIASLSYYADPVFPVSGLLAGNRARRFFQGIVGDILIENLPITFIAVATDLLTGETVPLDSGPLADAIMASISMPGIFKPVVHMGRLLTDGGVSDPLPLDILRTYSPDITIACNLHTKVPARFSSARRRTIIRREQSAQAHEEDLAAGLIERLTNLLGSQKILENREKLNELFRKSFPKNSEGAKLNIFEVLASATNIQQFQKNRLMLRYEPPDILIEPDVMDIGSLEFTKGALTIDEGRLKAQGAVPKIMRLLEKKRKIISQEGD